MALGITGGTTFRSYEPIKLLDYTAGGNLLYSGDAKSGSSTADAVWRIRKYIYTTNQLTAVLYADGDIDYNNVWDDRASLSYS